MATIEETLALAKRHHQAGNAQYAEQLYRQVVEAAPDLAEAHHCLGVLAWQSGQYIQAATSLAKAVQLNPNAAVYFYNLGLARSALSKWHEAASSFQEALRLQPDFAQAHNGLGDTLRRLGQLAEAAKHCQEAISLGPSFAEAHNTLGAVLLEMSNPAEAAVSFQNALRLNPKLADAHLNLGIANFKQNHFAAACDSYRAALRLQPRNVKILRALGLASFSDGQFTESAHCFEEILHSAPDDADAHCNLATALERLGEQGRAVKHYLEAVRWRPEWADAHLRLAKAVDDQGNLPLALAYYRQAVRLQPDHADANLNLSLALLASGDFEHGWPAYEWRLKPSGANSRSFSQPRWDGSDFSGKTLLLWAEQGLGDMIQFVRYLPRVKERGGRVVVECQLPLLQLLQDLPGIDSLVPFNAQLPEFGVQIPLLSLPGIFHNRLDASAADIPYLKADDRQIAQWRQVLGPPKREGGQRFRIGIAWQGNPHFRGDRLRSFPLRCFAAMTQIEEVDLVSLQVGPGAEQMASIAAEFSVLDLANRLGNESQSIMNIAAVMKNLDLVISCDSAVAHLAGALGVAAWIALPLVADWRWLRERQDSPWYPTMRLFRQSRHSNWEDVFERMAGALRRLM